MVERCELCGARLRSDDVDCRECGTPRVAEPKSALLEVGPVFSDPQLPVIEFPSDPGLAAPPDAPLMPPPEFAGADPAPPLEFAAPPEHEPRPATVVAEGPPVSNPPADSVVAPKLSVAVERDEGSTPLADVEVPPTAPGAPPDTSPSFGSPSPSMSLEAAAPRRFPVGLAFGAILLLVGGSVAAAVVMRDRGADDEPAAGDDGEATPEPDEPPSVAGDGGDGALAIDRCAGIDAIAGKWTFATQVTGARTKSKLDIRGYYTADIQVDGCKARAEVKKTGYTGATFPDRHVQVATAELVPGEGPFLGTFVATFELRDSVNRGVDLELGFVEHEGRLVGLSRESGSRWDKTGLYGVLVGAKEGAVEEMVPTVGALPCPSRCTISCDGLRRESLPDDALGRCVAACEGGEELPACGDRKPPDASLTLDLQGPKSTLKELCGPKPYELDPRLEKRRPRALKDSDGAVGFLGAHITYVGKPKGKGALHLALQTDAGWFLSAPMVALAKDGTKAVGRARVGASVLGQGDAPATVIGTFVHEEAGAHVFACRIESGRPVCVLARGLADLDRAAPIPGQTFAVYQDGESLYAW